MSQEIDTVMLPAMRDLLRRAGSAVCMHASSHRRPVRRNLPDYAVGMVPWLATMQRFLVRLEREFGEQMPVAGPQRGTADHLGAGLLGTLLRTLLRRLLRTDAEENHDLVTLGEAEKATGIPRTRLDHACRVGRLPYRRTETGARLLSHDVVEKLRKDGLKSFPRPYDPIASSNEQIASPSGVAQGVGPTAQRERVEQSGASWKKCESTAICNN